MLEYSLAVAVTSASLLFLSVYFYSKNKLSYWKRKGVPGPEPTLLAGTILQSYLGNRMHVELERVKKYGKVYGAYQGHQPLLIVADPEVVQQVCIKDFDVFPNHAFASFGNKYSKSFLISLNDDHWKKVRAFMSPTFTSGKIRRMFRFLDGCADDMVQCFKEQIAASGSKDSAIVNAKDLYNLYTLDAIATCCYGLKLERNGASDLKTASSRDEFVRLAMKQFEFSLWRFFIIAAVPHSILKFFNFSSSPLTKILPLAEKVRILVDKRRNSTRKFDDYLQLLVDARLDAEMELDEMDSAENHHAGLTNDLLREEQRKMLEELKLQKTDVNSKLILTDIEILSNAIFLLIVGLETTGTLLTHCSCILAFHPEIQEKLYQELMAIAEYNEDKTKLTFSYDSLTSCKYLDSVISETLRLIPPVIQIDRISKQPYRIEKYNIDLPAGSRVFPAYYAILNDPDFWPEPEKFDPERFMPGNREKIVPGSYTPFGCGPRACIGLRFSLTEAKLALARLLTHFRFEPAPGATWPLEPQRTLAINNIKDPRVTIVARN